MFNNYFKIAVRNFKRHKTYSLINILGLSIGFVVCGILSLWVANELSYDKFNEHKNEIHRIGVDLKGGSHMVFPMVMPAAAELMVEEYPEVVNAVRIQRPHRSSIILGDKKVHETNVCHADNSIFQVFSFPFAEGNPQNALTAPFTVVLTESMAKKYFGDESPIGKIIKIGGETEYAITGVIKDIPQNSHFRFNMACSFQTLYAQDKALMENWFHIQFYTYLQFNKNADIRAFEKKLPAFVDKHMKTILERAGFNLTFFLQPLTKIHLYSDIGADIAPQGDILYVYLFSAIAIFVLLVACINFINLTTARSTIRAMEIGMRKTLGANVNQIRLQFMIESALYSFISLLFAFILMKILLPFIQPVFNFHFELSTLFNFKPLCFLVSIAIITGLIAGGYPAVYLSGIQPVRALKGGLNKGYHRSFFRNCLVVFQFVVSVFLIIGTLTTYHQINFMKLKKTGFNKENVLVLPGMRKLLTNHSAELVRQKFINIPTVSEAGFASLVPSRGAQGAVMHPEGFPEDQTQMGEKLFIDANYIPALGIQIEEGRNFSKSFITDPEESVLINRTAAKTFGWENALGKTFSFPSVKDDNGIVQKMKVVGVVSDFHSKSLHSPIKPLIFYNRENRVNYLALKIKSADLSNTIQEIEKVWSSLSADLVFDYFFLDESIDRLYRSEEQFGSIALYFCMLTVFIGCMGLFGLAAFMISQRTKEIGIRKVMGASNTKIITLISSEFLLLVGISNIIAWPLAYFLINKWLQNFAYHVDPEWWIFIIAGSIAGLIAMISIGFQTIKAASANPVESLKYE